MKKSLRTMISIILMICLAAALFVGCGSDDDDDDDRKSDSKKNTTTADDSDNKEPTKAPEKASYTIADYVLVDNETCKVTIVKAEEDDFWGFKVKLLCENKTPETSLMFSADDVSVNGYMIEPYWAVTVAAGKKANGEMTFDTDYFEQAGITMADEIKFTLKVYDSEEWGSDYFVKEQYAIYPTGKSADTVQYPARKTTDKEQVVIDNNDVCFIILSADKDDFWGYGLECYVENKTNATLMYTWDDVSVNGFMIDPIWSKSLGPGMKCYTKITFFDSDFEENGITTVEEIGYTMRIYNYDDWTAEDAFKETLSYKP